MKKILTVFTFLILSFFSTTSKSDSVFDLDLSGFVLGDSIKKHFEENEISSFPQSTKYTSDRCKKIGHSKNIDPKYNYILIYYEKSDLKIGLIFGTTSNLKTKESQGIWMFC